MIRAKLAIGPLSSEIIEAVYRYSDRHGDELMLIASKNQIDFDGGYVNNWTTADYARFLFSMRQQYPRSRVLICRDHCGPGFRDGKKETLDDSFRTVEEDVKCGFHLLHLDLCRYEADQNTKIDEIKKLMQYALEMNPKVMFEVGTDENDGNLEAANVEEVEKNVESILEVTKPEFYVLQTGSLIKEARQVGCFEKKVVVQFCDLLNRYKIKLKEHNADYLTSGQIGERRGLVGAVNIAPQLGVIQTSTVLNQCLIHGISTEAFMRLVYGGGKWKKWSLGHLDNYYAATLVAGHYHFHDEEYQNITRQLSDHLNLSELVIQCVEKVIYHYLKSLS